MAVPVGTSGSSGARTDRLFIEINAGMLVASALLFRLRAHKKIWHNMMMILIKYALYITIN